MPISISRTADGHPAIRVRYLTFALLPRRNGEGFTIYTKYPAIDPEASTAATFDSFDRHVASLAEFELRVQTFSDHLDEVEQLDRKTLTRQISTPWGSSDSRKRYDQGIELVGTPSHGGFIVDAQRNAQIHAAWRNASGHYEEDCCWAIVAYTFPHLFTRYERSSAESTLKGWYPDAWEIVTGQTIKPGESHERDRALFLQKHSDDLIVVSAINSRAHPGQVECLATRGGDRSFIHTPQALSFLVPSNEYTSSGFGFVIDEKRHPRIDRVGNVLVVGAMVQ
ncbi:hypothetical protein [Sphingosinicella sp. BN140058]|uniref:DUF7007 domain-containing protein n=1 Tax=Sphingosinicella sp. BN140058 TaxID=1892855 RepID=UPI0010117FE4|nr:hypothetical protein [Sphingosinicella sp. BN140058]QAY80388.1 hypothetical protein ETR14_27495 [Sphingosinicella sp. BN140058]